MSLGKKNQGNSNNKLYVLRLKRKAINKETGKEEDIFPNAFEISEKNADGKWVAREKLETNVSGDLVRIDLGTGEWQGQEYKTAKLFLEDSESQETFLLDLRSTQLSRSLFNSLIALQTFDNLEVSNYSTVSKKNGETYANISLWQAPVKDGKGVLVKGVVPLDKIPKPEEIKDKKGVVQKRIYDDVDTFWWNHLAELSKRLEKARKGSSGTKPTNPQKEPADNEPSKGTDVPEEEVPF